MMMRGGLDHGHALGGHLGGGNLGGNLGGHLGGHRRHSTFPKPLFTADARWTPPAEFASNTESYERRLHSLTGRAKQRLQALNSDVTSEASMVQLEMALFELRSHRFAVQPLRLRPLEHSRTSTRPVSKDSAELMILGGRSGGPWSYKLDESWAEDDHKHTKAEVRRPQWKLETSMWAPRRKWADAGDFHDTAEHLRCVFDGDWSRARQSGGLDKQIVRNSTSDDGVGAVQRVFHENLDVVYSAFDYFAAGGSSSDIFNIQQNAFDACETIAPSLAVTARMGALTRLPHTA
jgi:hypothetical protein